MKGHGASCGECKKAIENGQVHIVVENTLGKAKYRFCDNDACHPTFQNRIIAKTYTKLDCKQAVAA